MARSPTKIRVVNELDQSQMARIAEAVEGLSPYRTIIIPEDGADDARLGALTLPYNPPSYEIDDRANWEPRKAAGVSHQQHASDWVNSDPERLSMSLTLQPLDADENDRIVSTLRRWMLFPSKVKNRPPILRVQQGMGDYTKNFWGHLAAMNASAITTDAVGRIETLGLRLEFTQNLPQ